MKFSIVIINHNYGTFLAQAIESALDQTCPEREVIVVDDGSSDDSRSVIERYRGSITAHFQSPLGHVSAANAGFALTTGDAILFLDADDFLYPHCLEAASALFESDTSKLQFRLDTIDGDGHDQNAPFPYFPDDLTPQEILRQSLAFGVYPWTVSSGNVFARRYLEQVMPLDNRIIFRSPDGYLSKMAPLYGGVKSSNEIVGAYRVHGKNAWASSNRSVRDYPANRWVRFDQVLCEAFNQRSKELGYPPRSYDELVSVQRIEHRLMGFRADRENYPLSQDTARHLFALGLRSARLAPNLSNAGRMAWSAWYTVLAFAPLGVIDYFYRSSRTQKGRSRLARLIIRLARGRARKVEHAS